MLGSLSGVPVLETKPVPAAVRKFGRDVEPGGIFQNLRGTLDLPPFNGVLEGILIGCHPRPTIHTFGIALVFGMENLASARAIVGIFHGCPLTTMRNRTRVARGGWPLGQYG